MVSRAQQVSSYRTGLHAMAFKDQSVHLTERCMNPLEIGDDGASTDGSLQILAVGLACNAGMLGDQRLIAMSRYGNESPGSVDLAAMGNGMMVEWLVGDNGGRVRVEAKLSFAEDQLLCGQ